MEWTEEHEGFRRAGREVIDREIELYVDVWEEAGAFPAHRLFEALGSHGMRLGNEGGWGCDRRALVATGGASRQGER